MPFMQGRGALRRTIGYLEKGSLVLRDNVRIMAFHYNPSTEKIKHEHHTGLDQFVFWHAPQMKYKNPDVQLLSFKLLTPSPFIRVFLEDDRQIFVDCDSRTRQEIHDHLKKIFGKSDEEIEMRTQESITHNPANFGFHYDQQCICEVPGQVSCPSWTPLPKKLRGKWQRKLALGEIEASELED